MTKILIIASLALLSGCASIASGTTQQISVNSSPGGADCDLIREGAKIHHVTTPASPLVNKTKHDITVACSKPRYQDAQAVNKSGVEPWVLGNLIFGGLIGLVIDVSSGAQNHYDETTTLNLTPAPAPAAMQPTTSTKPTS